MKFWKNALKVFLLFSSTILISCSGKIEKREINSNLSSAESNHTTYSPDSVIKIAVVQSMPFTEPDSILSAGRKFCYQAKELEADMVVFPEMYSIGYEPGLDLTKEGSVDLWRTQGEYDTGRYVTFFRNLARELDMAILVTYLEKWEPLPRNTALLIDRFGVPVLKYSKVHTVEIGFMEAAITPGDDFYVADLDTRIGKIKTGVMICYDREFPESARILMLKGAELILTPNACKLDHLRIIQFQSRAWENSLVTVMANYSGDPYFGHSCAFNADGKEILLAGEEEGVYMAEINFREVREYRNRTFWGNAYRRPRKYGLIGSEEVNPPFIRKDAYGKPFDRKKR